ncbi:molybdopterin molybdotransferase MoeA [bacterium]|nr:molybdopterin molybdotransferase MoeA [bacterium]
MNKMLSYEAAQELVLKTITRLDAETLPLKQLYGRCLAEPLLATVDLPGFDSTAMDGYAVKLADIEKATDESPVRLPVAADIHAGDVPTIELKSGTAQRVMTGAPIPKGTETIVIREDTNELGDFVEIRKPAKLNMNIRRQGEEFKQGDMVLPAGTRLNPAGVALIASLGLSEFKVYRQPKVSILTTGSEVVAQGKPLKPGELYDSNSWGLLAALQEMRIEPVSIAHVADTVASTVAALKAAAEQSDIIITTGGVSMGDSDFVKPALRELNAEIYFEKVAVKPGRPMCFANIKHDTDSRQTFVFGCPGNPVSVLVSFHGFVKPAIQMMMGLSEFAPFKVTAKLTKALKKKAGRRENVRGYVQAKADGFYVTPTQGQMSHMLSGMAVANCIIHFPAGDVMLPEGSAVEVELLSPIY